MLQVSLRCVLASYYIWHKTQNSSQDTADPDALAAALSQSTVWDSVKLSCGGDPTLLGTCTFDPKTRSPVPSALKLWSLGEGGSTLSFVLYRSHAPQSLRFYVIDPPEYPSAPPRRDFYEELARYDFTRPEGRNLDQALNDVVIDQVCFPMSLSAATHNPFIFLDQCLFSSSNHSQFRSAKIRQTPSHNSIVSPHNRFLPWRVLLFLPRPV